MDREKVITGLELCTDISQDGCMMLCPYRNEQDETYSGFCEQVLKRDALAMLKEQEAIVRCKDCKHGQLINGEIWCSAYVPNTLASPDWFCADGVKKDE